MNNADIVKQQDVHADKIAISRELRRRMTPQEAALCARLRNNQLGVRFRRQQIIDGFIVDFYCHAASLIVEVDGPVHDYQRHEDREREVALRQRKLHVMRITNDDVSDNIDGVLARIDDVVCARRGTQLGESSPHGSPSPMGEGPLLGEGRAEGGGEVSDRLGG